MALTQQLDAPSEAINVHQGPEWVSRADSVEEEHDSRVVDAVEDSTFLVHPESDDVTFTGVLLRQGLGPEATLGHQVRAGVLGQRVRVDAGRVLACEAQPQGPAPAALLLGDLVAGGGLSPAAPPWSDRPEGREDALLSRSPSADSQGAVLGQLTPHSGPSLPWGPSHGLVRVNVAFIE